MSAILPRARERQKSTHHRKQHHSEGDGSGLDFYVVEEQALDGLVDDDDARQKQETGFDEGGEILDFAVAVLVVGVGGLVGDADGKERDDRGDQVEKGVGSFGQNAEAAGGDADENL